jgi:hypothetical protein
MTSAQIALIALRELIRIQGQGYGEEWFKVDSNWNSVLWRLTNVFRNFKDNNKFVGDLMDRVCELAWDDNVNSYNIEKFDE